MIDGIKKPGYCAIYEFVEIIAKALERKIALYNDSI